MPDGERHITEAEYLACAERKRAQMAEEFTALLPQEARDRGMRFEWPQPEHPPASTPGPCTRSEYGFMVHVKGACECPGRGR